jgi:hypothetical protein
VGAELVKAYEASEADIVRDCVKLADDLLARGLLVIRAE